ncbi:MAG: DinB family protein [Betaproteobacteria bacterium]
MSPLAHHLYTMACNNAWANHRLLTACATLSQDDFIAPRTSFFPSLKSTLNHNLMVDRFYVDCLERSLTGQPPDLAPRNWNEPYVTCADILTAQHAVDRRLCELCQRLTEAQLLQAIEVPRRAGIQRESTTRLLAHLFEHQVHHRGQAHAMLAGTHVPPPQLDEFFCANEAHLRAAELAELGLTEEGIWAAHKTLIARNTTAP